MSCSSFDSCHSVLSLVFGFRNLSFGIRAPSLLQTIEAKHREYQANQRERIVFCNSRYIKTYDQNEDIEEAVSDLILTPEPSASFPFLFFLFVWQGSGLDQKHAGGFFRFL
jgi:hypothetical protein